MIRQCVLVLNIVGWIWCERGSGEIHAGLYGVNATTPAPNVHYTNAGHVQLDSPMRDLVRRAGDTVRLMCEISGQPVPQYVWLKDGLAVRDPRGGKNPHYRIRTTAWGSRGITKPFGGRFWPSDRSIEQHCCRLTIHDASVRDSGVYTCEGWNKFARRFTNGTLLVIKPTDASKGLADLDASDHAMELHPGSDHELPVIHDTLDMEEEGLEGLDDGQHLEKSKLEHSGGDASVNDIASGDFSCQPYRGSACLSLLGNHSVYVPTGALQQSYLEDTLTEFLSIIVSDAGMSAQCGKYILPAACHFAFPLCDAAVMGSSFSASRLRRLCRTDCERVQTKLCRDELEFLKNQRKTQGMGSVLPDCSLLPDNTHKCAHIRAHKPLPAVTQDTGIIPGSDKPEAPFSFVALIVICLLVPLIIGVLLLIKHLCRPSSLPSTFPSFRAYIPPRHVTTPSTGSINFTSRFTSSPLAGQSTQEISASRIQILEELGRGRFGKVFRGELCGGDLASDGGERISVALLCIRTDAGQQLRESFWNDAEVTGNLRHENITCLLGVCTRELPLCAVFELTAIGDLHDYLQMHSPSCDLPQGDLYGQLRQSEMIHIIVQIAAGMEYLSNKRHVHGDIAARNILIGVQSQVKISLLKHIPVSHASDYCSLKQDGYPVPLRWMSPEAIIEERYNVASDVWALGVTVWEVFAFGLQPYCGLTNSQVIEAVKAQRLLACPDGCPLRVYSLMVECWNRRPAARPDFRRIHQRLRQWQRETVIVQASHLVSSVFVRQPSSGSRQSRGRQITEEGTNNLSVVIPNRSIASTRDLSSVTRDANKNVSMEDYQAPSAVNVELNIPVFSSISSCKGSLERGVLLEEKYSYQNPTFDTNPRDARQLFLSQEDVEDNLKFSSQSSSEKVNKEDVGKGGEGSQLLRSQLMKDTVASERWTPAAGRIMAASLPIDHKALLDNKQDS